MIYLSLWVFSSIYIFWSLVNINMSIFFRFSKHFTILICFFIELRYRLPNLKKKSIRSLFKINGWYKSYVSLNICTFYMHFNNDFYCIHIIVKEVHMRKNNFILWKLVKTNVSDYSLSLLCVYLLSCTTKLKKKQPRNNSNLKNIINLNKNCNGIYSQ